MTEIVCLFVSREKEKCSFSAARMSRSEVKSNPKYLQLVMDWELTSWDDAERKQEY